MAEPDDESVTLRQWTDVVRRARLGRTTKAVALMMATYADNDGSRVFPGISRLAVDCELTYNVVQSALRTLRAAGLIEVVRKASRRGQADEYRLILAANILDRVEVLTPAQVATAAADLAGHRRGRYRPATPAARSADELRPDLHHTAPGAGADGATDLHTSARGAGHFDRHRAAPHGDVPTAAAAPHGTVHLHPTASPPTTHGPQHHPHHPNDSAVLPDGAVVGDVEAAAPGRASDGRCAHGLDGPTGVRCPACRRNLPVQPSVDGAAGRPHLQLVRSA
ncbi:helix-turn-helix domain-containing protein [Dactylosporangium darangshiense]|uniref:Helix-turn-helix domain-containing protein n=1 Tax=Dactylosporangium darangshiense TaxID=579108 RepID=A0ABP8DN05_9ACTN